MFCKYCGKEVKEGAKFCENCGKPLNDEPVMINEVKAEPKMDVNPAVEKKPITKKWWFWAIIVVVVIIVVLKLVAGSKKNVATEVPTTTSIEEPTTETSTEAPKAKKVSSKLRFTYADFAFKLPGYYKQSTYLEGFDYAFCPEEKNYYATIAFTKVEVDSTKEEFEASCETIGDGLVQQLMNKAENIKRSTIVVDGTNSYFAEFRVSETNAAMALLFDDISNEVVVVFCAVDDSDESEYDYIGDVKEMLVTDDTSLIRLTSKKIEEVKDSKKEESKTTGIRPEFKEALDSYEQFFNEYADLMEAYKNNPTDLQLLTKYADFMSKYSDYMQKLDELKTEDMSTEESAYFIDVTARIEKRLLEVTQ